jgi:IS5 family transposase
MFKALILQASHGLSDEQTEYLIRDRLSFMRFLGLGLADSGARGGSSGQPSPAR